MTDSHACVCRQPIRHYSDGSVCHDMHCPQNQASGLMCRTHFDMPSKGRLQWMINECEACQAAKKAEAIRVQAEDTIDPTQPYGQKIGLYCRNHPRNTYQTKNIGWVGARSVFHTGGDNCDCPMSDLRIVTV